jgi:hypothetical protein
MRKKHKNTLCDKHAIFFHINAGGTDSKHRFFTGNCARLNLGAFIIIARKNIHEAFMQNFTQHKDRVLTEGNPYS